MLKYCSGKVENGKVSHKLQIENLDSTPTKRIKFVVAFRDRVGMGKDRYLPDHIAFQ